MFINGHQVKGKLLDHETRCQHYHSQFDIIAIKFPCCGFYYPCYQCHQEVAEHPPVKWKKAEWDMKAILCGNCGKELTINEYMNGQHQCPTCKADFNAGCQKHNHLYFSMKE
ncbi:CHY zinc finger protein [Bacillus carboniphilus]|uniref:CHY zinc finger protein n=1 Tax=Bacillus carboniphilus TaxID=86663 RepID=A0ABY9K0H9_9BACI|nr:CHY zinc finger protein [Bacillus carboniphilus]WLR44342.1 CHY zinc finger protein [Bacillus carboniphilus]